jgi:hypothetical protein
MLSCQDSAGEEAVAKMCKKLEKLFGNDDVGKRPPLTALKDELAQVLLLVARCPCARPRARRSRLTSAYRKLAISRAASRLGWVRVAFAAAAVAVRVGACSQRALTELDARDAWGARRVQINDKSIKIANRSGAKAAAKELLKYYELEVSSPASRLRRLLSSRFLSSLQP